MADPMYFAISDLSINAQFPIQDAEIPGLIQSALNQKNSYPFKYHLKAS
jgi:hypothetical protein